MSSYYYRLLKRSVDLEIVRQRKLFISDVATAFSDPKKGIGNLERQEKQMEHLYNSLFINSNKNASPSADSVSWDFPEDAADKMRRWQR